MAGAKGRTASRVDMGRWVLYVLGAAVSLGVVFLVSRNVATMSTLAVGACWAIMSAVVALGIAYPYIIRKLLNRHEYKPGGRLSRLNDGRIVRLTISFVAAAVLVAGLLFETTRWGRSEWLVAVMAIPIYLVCYALCHLFVSREFREEFQIARTMQASRVVTAVLLCIAYLLVLMQAPVESYGNATEAFMASANSFEGSPSVLLGEGGKFVALVNGLCAYMMSETAQASFPLYVAIKVLLGASTFYSIAVIMGLCSLRLSEIGKEFMSVNYLERGIAIPTFVYGEQGESVGSALVSRKETSVTPVASAARTGDAGVDAALVKREGGDSEDAPLAKREDGDREGAPLAKRAKRPRSAAPLVKRFVAVLAVLPVLLAGLFVVLDQKAADIVQTQEYTVVDQIVRDRAGMVVCVIDGKYYDYAAVQDFLARLNEDSLSLGEEAKAELTPLINAAFDQRIENVDAYLDWYYSLSADYESLAHLVDNTVEDFTREQLESYLSEGVDDTQLNERVAYYAEKAEALEQAAHAELAAYEVDVPEWLIQSKEDIGMDAFSAPFETTERLKSAGIRLAAGGVGAFILNHVVAKKVFSSMTKKLAAKLGVSSAEKIASIGFTAMGPLGVLVKIGADVVTTVALDGLFLMVDEKLNRDDYRQELVDGINEQREEMLALVG